MLPAVFVHRLPAQCHGRVVHAFLRRVGGDDEAVSVQDDGIVRAVHADFLRQNQVPDQRVGNHAVILLHLPAFRVIIGEVADAHFRRFPVIIGRINSAVDEFQLFVIIIVGDRLVLAEQNAVGIPGDVLVVGIVHDFHLGQGESVFHPVFQPVLGIFSVGGLLADIVVGRGHRLCRR